MHNENKSINILINKIKKREKLKLDNNYYFTPIYTFLLIDLLLKLIAKKARGVFNLVGDERISKYQCIYKKPNCHNQYISTRFIPSIFE